MPFRRILNARSALPTSAALALGVLCASCGGATPKTRSPSQHADDSAGQGAVDGDNPADNPAPKPPSCDDGTCFSCGDGICPTGFYCDRKAPGGAACSWLPACAKQASCGCVQKALGSGCSCNSENGGVYVDCE